MSNFRPTAAMKAVKVKSNAEMEAFDQLPADLRRILAEADFPYPPTSVLQQTRTIHPKYVADLLKSRERAARAQHARAIDKVLGQVA